MRGSTGDGAGLGLPRRGNTNPVYGLLDPSASSMLFIADHSALPVPESLSDFAESVVYDPIARAYNIASSAPRHYWS